NFLPALGDDLDAPGLDGANGRLGERLGADEPLRRDARLDDGFAALALADDEAGILGLDEEALGFEVGDDALAGFEAIEAGVGAGVFIHVGRLVHDGDFRKVVAFPGGEVVGVVSGGNLDGAGSEARVGDFVEDDRDLAIHQWERDGFAVEVRVALVGGVYGDVGVPGDGFGAGGGDAAALT